MFYLTEKDRPGPWGIATDRSWERRLNSLPNTGTTKIKNQKTYYESNSYIDAMMIHNYPSLYPSSRSITNRHSRLVIEREFDAFEPSVNTNAQEASARWRSAVTSRTPGTDQMTSRSRNRQLLVRSTRFANSTTRTCGISAALRTR